MSRFSRSDRTRKCLAWLAALVVLAGLIHGAWPAAAAAQASYPGLESPDPDVRAETVQAIRRAGDPAAWAILLEHIDDPDERVGLYVAQALVELAPGDALTPLRATLWLADNNGRWRAAFVLGERRDVRAIPVLARALRDKEVLVSRTAAEALAKIDGQAAINALIRSLVSERPSEVHAAMNGLRIIGDAAIPALARAMDSGNPPLEWSAATVLQALGTPLAWSALQGTPTP